jgi:hypothetical protein
MSYTTQDAVKMAMEGDAHGFQTAINNILMDKVRDAVDLKKIEVASNFMTTDIEEEVEIEEEELIDESVDAETMKMVQKYGASDEISRLKRYDAETRGLTPDQIRDKKSIIARARAKAEGR